MLSNSGKRYETETNVANENLDPNVVKRRTISNAKIDGYHCMREREREANRIKRMEWFVVN
jgi:hypothetical protein